MILKYCELITDFESIVLSIIDWCDVWSQHSIFTKGDIRFDQ